MGGKGTLVVVLSKREVKIEEGKGEGEGNMGVIVKLQAKKLIRYCRNDFSPWTGSLDVVQWSRH